MKYQSIIHTQPQPIRIMQFWGGVPQSPNSKWLQTLRIIEKCAQKGWKNIIVFSEKPQSQDLINPFLDAGAKILFHQRPPSSFNVRAIFNTTKFLHHHPSDVIHCYNRPFTPLIAATFNHIPARIWSRLSMSTSYKENIPPTGVHKLQLNLRLSCLLSHKVICIAQPVLQELTDLSNAIKKKSTIIGGAINLKQYSSGSPANIRKEFSLSIKDFLIISVGHAVPVKGWDILIIAYAKFQQSFPQSKLLLVGSIELDHEKETLQSLIHLIKTLSLTKNVILTGKRNDIPDFLAAGDIYIQSSRSEGLCGALIEALAAGLPCIASNVGGTKDAIHNGKNGLLFEREDINELTERMLTLAQNIELRKKLASNALPSIQHYDLETVTDNIINIYNELLTNRGLLKT